MDSNGKKNIFFNYHTHDVFNTMIVTSHAMIVDHECNNSKRTGSDNVNVKENQYMSSINALTRELSFSMAGLKMICY